MEIDVPETTKDIKEVLNDQNEPEIEEVMYLFDLDPKDVDLLK